MSRNGCSHLRKIGRTAPFSDLIDHEMAPGSVVDDGEALRGGMDGMHRRQGAHEDVPRVGRAVYENRPAPIDWSVYVREQSRAISHRHCNTALNNDVGGSDDVLLEQG